MSTTLTEKGTVTYTVVGDLCLPASGKSSVLLVLVHGATYDATYWDFPGFGGGYSFASAMNQAGYATLAVDMLGIGRSSHPRSSVITIQAEARAIHNVISAARSGKFGIRFKKIILAGHSLGTLTSFVEIAMFKDVDGFIATGGSHSAGLLASAMLYSHATLALLDPITKPEIPYMDLGYLSMMNAREHYYSGGVSDPAVVAADEARRRPLPLAYQMTLAPYFIANDLLRTDEINVPVLIANGQGDLFYCSQGGGLSATDCSCSEALRADEARYFAPGARLEAFVLKDSGHSINLVPHAQEWYNRCILWLQYYFPLP